MLSRNAARCFASSAMRLEQRALTPVFRRIYIPANKVRTPTVFTENRVIAQRHFNAVVFAKFLRIKIADERVLGQIKQQIRLEGFLPREARADIPDGWFQLRPATLYLDFLEWLGQQKAREVFQTAAGRSLLDAVSTFNTGVAAAAEKYRLVLGSIADELSALIIERKKLYERGGQISDIEQAIKNLLGSDIISALAKRGFLPRYAFPLDVVNLETGRTRWSRDAEVELSRDRGIAIAEFAPSAQVIAHKKVFTSAGLYVVSKMDRPERKWYSECPSCKQIRTEITQDKLIGSCPVCQRSITTQYIRPFVEPLAFSVRIDEKEGAARYRRSTLIRQRQALIAHTRSNAYLLFMEKNLGSLERGKPADLVVFDRDYVTIPVDDILNIKPVVEATGIKLY